MTPLPAARPSALTTTGTSLAVLEESDGIAGIVEDLVVARRHIGVAQQILAEDLAGFQLGGRLVRAEDAKLFFLEGIDDAGGQRGLGADDRQLHVVVFGEPDQRAKVARIDRDVLGVEVGSRIAGRDEDAVCPGALSDFPSQGVFSPTISNDQDVHIFSSSFKRRPSRDCSPSQPPREGEVPTPSARPWRLTYSNGLLSSRENWTCLSATEWPPDVPACHTSVIHNREL